MAEADCLNLEQQFESATQHLETLVASLDDNQKLYFYARFKQAKEGPCNIPKPGFLNFAARKKWCSWNDLGEMSKELAMREYVDAIIQLDSSWNPSESVEKQKQMGLGFSVSTLRKDPADFLEDKDKTIFDWVKEGEIEQVTQHLNDTDVNKLDDEGMSLLHWACDRGHCMIVEQLLKRGADINIKDSEGQTPLHYASFCGHASVIEVLLNNGADDKITDDEGQHPHDVASDSNIAQLIVSR